VEPFEVVGSGYEVYHASCTPRTHGVYQEMNHAIESGISCNEREKLVIGDGLKIDYAASNKILNPTVRSESLCNLRGQFVLQHVPRSVHPGSMKNCFARFDRKVFVTERRNASPERVYI
jgi:hypothetical protein